MSFNERVSSLDVWMTGSVAMCCGPLSIVFPLGVGDTVSSNIVDAFDFGSFDIFEAAGLIIAFWVDIVEVEVGNGHNGLVLCTDAVNFGKMIFFVEAISGETVPVDAA